MIRLKAASTKQCERMFLTRHSMNLSLIRNASLAKRHPIGINEIMYTSSLRNQIDSPYTFHQKPFIQIHNFSTSSNPCPEKNFSDSMSLSNDSVTTQNFSGSSPILSETGSVMDSETAAAAVSSSNLDALPFSTTWYNPVDHTINLLMNLDSLSNLPFTFTIIGTTIAIRTALVPLYIKSQRNASRVAHMKPEMEALKAKFDKLGKNVDVETQKKMNEEMFALFKKYDCNPMNGLILPFLQAPVFISMFFALQRIPVHFPETLSSGGLLWFPNLSIPDPMFILPVLSSAIFIATIELGKKNMEATSSNPLQSNMMITLFRGMGLLMIPITINFPAAVLCYWVTNNSYTLCLSTAFQQKSIRDAAGIWELPKPVPGAPKPKGLQEMIQDIMKQNKQIEAMAKKEEENLKK